ncbi:MAG: hypothetical protein KC563_14345, partial [Nitrospira sp.]|nr:hypothetical protein [Nitrospira sp.]
MNYTRRVKLWVAILLSGCFLVVSSGLASSPETHIHDGHHHQQTHGKTWCSWTCQAGNGLQGFTPLIPKCCFHIVPVHQDNPP